MHRPKTDPLQGIIIHDEDELFRYARHNTSLSHSMLKRYNKFISKIGHRHPVNRDSIKAITTDNRQAQIADLQKRFRPRPRK